MKHLFNILRICIAGFILIVEGSFGSGIFAQLYQFDFESLARDGYTIDGDNPLVQDAWQFSSPFSQNDSGNTDGGNLSDGVLIDEDAGSFWHSYWGGGSVAGGTHYFQIEMSDDLDPKTLIAFVFTRRNTNNDHTTAWKIMGTDDPDASKDECEMVAYVETPFSRSNETCMSEPFERGEFTYLRFYSETQYPNTRGYFHLAEFNIFPAIKMAETDVAQRELDETYQMYSAYYDSFDGRTGTDPGDYDEAAVQAFVNAIDAYSELPDEPTVEQLQACRDNIITTYEAIAPTKVPFTAKNLPSGYYRIIGGMMYTNDGKDVEKYMCGYRADGKIWGIWATPQLDEAEENIQALWKITAVTDTTFDVQNMYHDGRFMPIVRGRNAEMTTEDTYADTLLTFDAVATNHDDGISYVNIRLAKQLGSDGTYLHQGGHSNGNGVSGYLVGWYNTWNDNGSGASEWYFEKVEDDEARNIINSYNKDEDIWKADFKEMMKTAPGMIEIAKDVQKKIEKDKPLVSDNNPITSPCSDSAEGQHIEYLWDGNTGNFWHSDWHGEFTSEDHHYIQIEITDSEAYASSVFTFTRRNSTSGNQIYKWNVVGYNEDNFDLVQEDGKLLAEIETPYHAGINTESYISNPFITKGYKYIRFYCMGTKSNSGAEGQSKFMHLAEFQVYPGEIYQSPTNQYAVMGEIATNLEQLVEEFAELEDEDLTKEDNYQPLKAAYDAFVAKFVDPSDLRAAIAQYELKSSNVIVGTNPGFWPNSATADALNKTIADAKAYDEAGAYLLTTSEEFITTMGEQSKAIDAAPNKIKEGIWYHLRLGNQEEYEQYKWAMDGCDADYNNDGNIVDEALFGKYVTVADLLTENGCHNIIPIQDDAYLFNHYLFVDDNDDIENKDMSLWRFINVGDSAFAIQNKATGLFMGKKTIENYVRLSIHPALFTQHPAGYGQNALFIKSLSGEPQNPLHIGRTNNIVVTWNGWGDSDGRRGCFFIEEAGDVAEDYNAPDFNIPVIPGTLVAGCYPIDLTCKGEDAKVWTVSKVEGNQVTFAPIANQTVAAGQPFILLKGSVEDYNEQADYETVTFSHGMTLTSTPIQEGILCGTFIQQTIGAGYMIPSTNKLIVTLSSTQAMVPNSVWIVPGEDFNPKAAVETIIEDKDLIIKRLQAALEMLTPYLQESVFYAASLREQGVSLNTQGGTLLNANDPDLSAMATTTKQIKGLVQEIQAGVEAYQALLATIENIKHRESVATGVSDENKAELDAALTAALSNCNAGSYSTEEALGEITSLTQLANRLLTSYLVITVEAEGALGDSIQTYVTDFTLVENLKVIGPLNSNDITTLQNLTALVEVDLSEAQITNLNSAFQNHTALKVAILPNTLTNITSSLFSGCSALEDVTLPGSLNNIGTYIFSGIFSLKRVTLKEGVTTLSSSMFRNCYNLSEVNLPSTLQTIGSSAFYNCYSYADIQLPGKLQTIGNYAFYRDRTGDYYYNERYLGYDENGNWLGYAYDTIPNLCPKFIEIPASVTSIGYDAFYNMRGLESVTLNEGLTSIGYNAFYNTGIRTATFPSTLTSVGYSVFNSGTHYTSQSLVPPTANNGCPVEVPETLYVPMLAVKAYKQAAGWDKFKIVGTDILPDQITVAKQMTLDFANADVPEGYNPSITIWHTNVSVSSSSTPTTLGALDIRNAGQFTPGLVTHQGYNHAQANYYKYNWGYDYQQSVMPQSATLITDGTMHADNIDITLSLTDGYWNFISVPYDVRVGDITCETAETKWVIRRYDSEARAAGNLNSTWVNMTANDILEAGKGYIMHCTNNVNWLYNYVVFHFPALNNENKNLIFSASDRTIALGEYPSESANNGGWNLIGNPYPAYVEIGSTDFDAPITVWNGYNGYWAYSPYDDNYVLSPGEAFFVQRPSNKGSITFSADARKSYYDVKGTSNYVKGIRQNSSDRHVFNLYLSDGEHSDRTRVVINPVATMDYETERDAAKFPAMDATATQLYSIANGVQYAINERPLADGSVQLAAHFGQTGTYTFSLETKVSESVLLIDEAMGLTTELNGTEGYTFTAQAGTAANRFRIQIGAVETGIESLAADFFNDADVFTLDGKKVAGKPSITGVYLVKKNGIIRKVSVK